MRKSEYLILSVGLFSGMVSAQMATSILTWDGKYSSISNLPQTLSQSGFDPDNDAVFVPYKVNVPQYRNYMYASRYVSVPEGQKITPDDSIFYTFPKGTVLSRIIHLETVLGDPSSTINIEAQFQIRSTDSTWTRLAYIYRPDQTDADILTELDFIEREYYVNFGAVETLFQDTTKPGTPVQGANFPFYRFITDCESCHWNTSANGFITQQLNMGTQFHDLVAAGVLSAPPDLAGMEAAGKITKWVSRDDVAATTEQKVRSYLGGNCSHCHNNIEARKSTQTSRFDYWHNKTPLPFVDPVEGPIIPGRPDDSDALIRMEATEMPPNEVTLPDVRAIKMIWDWTNSLQAPGVPWQKIHITKIGPGKTKQSTKAISAILRNQTLRFGGGMQVSVRARLFTLHGREVKLKKISGATWLVLDQLVSGLYAVWVDGKSFPVQYLPL